MERRGNSGRFQVPDAPTRQKTRCEIQDATRGAPTRADTVTAAVKATDTATATDPVAASAPAPCPSHGKVKPLGLRGGVPHRGTQILMGSSPSRLWDLWETRRVFQAVAVNAERFPLPRQIPQPPSTNQTRLRRLRTRVVQVKSTRQPSSGGVWVGLTVPLAQGVRSAAPAQLPWAFPSTHRPQGASRL
jgi:hypothetical protein